MDKYFDFEIPTFFSRVKIYDHLENMSRQRVFTRSRPPNLLQVTIDELHISSVITITRLTIRFEGIDSFYEFREHYAYNTFDNIQQHIDCVSLLSRIPIQNWIIVNTGDCKHIDDFMDLQSLVRKLC
jgi:hypothetical protein